MTDRSQWRLIALLLAAAVLLAIFFTPGENRSALDPRASSFRATPQGTLGLFLLLEELGIPVERRVSPLVQGTPLPGVLVILEPSEALSPSEIDALMRWVDEGGRLIYAAGVEDPLLGALGLIVEPASGDSLGTLRLASASAEGDHPLLAEVETIYGFEFAFADSSRGLQRGGAVPLLRMDEQRLAAVLLRRGSGEILAWSDAAPLRNQSLRDAGGAALLFARSVAEFSTDVGGAVEFDEYHHGFRGGGSPASALVSFMAETPAGWMTLQLLVSGAGLLLLLGSRFGEALPPAPGRRRSPLEHLHALAQAYGAGGARNRARHLLLVGAARRLGRPPATASDEERLLATLFDAELHAGIVDRDKVGTRGEDERRDLVMLAGQVDRLVTERKRP